jgi:hypothetical protein
LKTQIKIVSICLVFIFACNNDDDTIEEIQHVTPVFVTELNPIDNEGETTDVSKNVIQGIASFENGWFVTQHSGTSTLLINYLDANGASLFHTRLVLNSHGQDLSLEQISDNQLFLYTTKGTFGENRNTGILKLNVSLPTATNGERDWSQTNISVDSEYNLDYNNCTPTLNKDKTQFAIRSAESILIHSKQNIESQNFEPTSIFQLHSEQIRDNGNFSMFFQGIAMKDNLIYCLAGNEKLITHKNIYVYNQNGTILDKFLFDINDMPQNFYEKFEPEALDIKDNELYFSIMTKSQTIEGNIKNLYKLTL